MKKFFKLLLVISLFNMSTTYAASFVIDDAQTNARTLDGTGETGVINSGGSLTVGADAVTVSAANVQITNAGTITTTGGFTAVVSNANDLTVTNSGSIVSSDFGINSSGERFTLINSGSITSTTSSIVSDGNDAVINNSGSLETADNYAGIESNGDNALITNSGSIVSLGNGIESHGNGDVINNSGSILLANGAVGIRSTGTGALIANSGTIVATKSGSDGILSSNAGVAINNDGTIVTQGSSSRGIRVSGANATITNSGAISVTGANSTAINLDSGNANDSTLTNTGTISATGDATQAIAGGTGAQTIFLGKGSRIIGTIDLSTGDDTITATGNGISTRVATVDSNTFVVNPGVAGVVVGNSIHTIDPTSVASLTISTNSLSKTIGEEVNSRVNVEEGKAWTKIFGSDFERGDDTKNLSYNHDYNGVIAGYEYGNNFGVILGVSTGEIKTDSQSFKSNVDSAFIGLYKDIEVMESTFINTNLIAGYEQYKNERTVVDNINGTQIARSDVNNLFISPSVELEHRIKLHEILQIIPNASASYTSSYFGSSKEVGATSSSIATEKRDAQILNLKAGISAVVTILKNYQINLGTGLDSRKISEDNASASISGNNFTFNTNNDKNTNGKYFNLGLNFIGFENLTFGVNANIRSADGNEDQKSVNLSGSYRF